jgi:hypothetical protein
MFRLLRAIIRPTKLHTEQKVNHFAQFIKCHSVSIKKTLVIY